MKIAFDDRTNPVWLRIKELCIAERSTLRAKLDADMPEAATIKLRGRIQQLTYLIDADQIPAPVPEDVPPA